MQTFIEICVYFVQFSWYKFWHLVMNSTNYSFFNCRGSNVIWILILIICIIYFVCAIIFIIPYLHIFILLIDIHMSMLIKLVRNITSIQTSGRQNFSSQCSTWKQESAFFATYKQRKWNSEQICLRYYDRYFYEFTKNNKFIIL